MANPLYRELNNGSQFNNGQIARFKQDLERLQTMYKDPKAEVERMLQSGQVSQAEVNECAKLAEMFSQFIR